MTVYCSICGLELTDPEDIKRKRHLDCIPDDDTDKSDDVALVHDFFEGKQLF